jgi:hypothetical protein
LGSGTAIGLLGGLHGKKINHVLLLLYFFNHLWGKRRGKARAGARHTKSFYFVLHIATKRAAHDKNKNKKKNKKMKNKTRKSLNPL